MLDVVLIPLGGMGPSGAAIATTVAEWISALSFLGVLAAKVPSSNATLGKNQQGNELVVIRPSVTIPEWQSVKPLIVASSSLFLRSVVLQASLAGAAAMAARSSSGGEASASVAAHQIALQVWLLGSFVCDALAAASQALVADAIGRSDYQKVRNVSQTILLYSILLGVTLAGSLLIAKDFVLQVFTSDTATQTALLPLVSVLIVAQPLNALVFSADGILQGASEFSYQAKTMVVSVLTGLCTFLLLENTFFGGADTLLHVWYALVSLQIMRAITSFVKLVDINGPIKLFGT